MFLKASGLWVQGYQELRVHRGAHLSPSNRCALFQRCLFRGSVNAMEEEALGVSSTALEFLERQSPVPSLLNSWSRGDCQSEDEVPSQLFVLKSASVSDSLSISSDSGTKLSASGCSESPAE